jgi:hypothetical protein
VSKCFQVGDLVIHPRDSRAWQVLEIYPDRGVAYLEFVGDAMNRYMFAFIADLQAYREAAQVV